MLETGLKQWLNREQEPSDFYQLVGVPRLCQDQARLLTAFQNASEYLFDFQNHKDKKTRDRARTFQLQVAEARRIVSDQGRWDKYDQDVIDRLRNLFLQIPNFSGPSARLDDLRRWLALVQQVDSGRGRNWCIDFGRNPAPKPGQPLVETQPLSSETTPTQALSKGQPNQKVATQPPTPLRGNPVSRPPVPRQPLGEMPAQKKDVPSAPSDLPMQFVVGKAPPPPPKDTPQSVPVLPRVPTNPVLPPVIQPMPPSSVSLNTLWIVMGIVLAVLCLGLLVLTLVWASGAFESRRSRAATSPVESNWFCQHRSGQTEPSDQHLET